MWPIYSVAGHKSSVDSTTTRKFCISFSGHTDVSSHLFNKVRMFIKHVLLLHFDFSKHVV